MLGRDNRNRSLVSLSALWPSGLDDFGLCVLLHLKNIELICLEQHISAFIGLFCLAWCFFWFGLRNHWNQIWLVFGSELAPNSCRLALSASLLDCLLSDRVFPCFGFFRNLSLSLSDWPPNRPFLNMLGLAVFLGLLILRAATTLGLTCDGKTPSREITDQLISVLIGGVFLDFWNVFCLIGFGTYFILTPHLMKN